MPGKRHRPSFGRFEEKVRRRILQYMKQTIFMLRRSGRQTRPIFIMGYGRSGTTMVLNAFDRDMRIEILGENDPRIAKNYLLIYDKISPAIAACKAEILVMKPILNSFDASDILDRYPDSSIIWMLRNYRDVVASATRKFGGVVATYMEELVLHGTGDNWLARGVPGESLEIMRKLNTQGYTEYDWTALVWWAVNRTIVTDELCQNERVLLVRYERLASDTETVMRKIYDTMELPYRVRAGAYIDTSSVGKGSDVTLDDAVDRMCATLSQEIEAMC